MTWSISTAGGTGNTDTVLLQASGDATYGSPQIQNYKVSKEASLTVIPIPTLDSNQVVALDALGTTRNFSITGFVIGTLAQLKEFIGDIEDKIYGKQFTNTNKGHTLTVEIDKTGVTTFYVIIKSFTYEWSAAEVSKIDYSLELMEIRNS